MFPLDESDNAHQDTKRHVSGEHLLRPEGRTGVKFKNKSRTVFAALAFGAALLDVAAGVAPGHAEAASGHRRKAPVK